MQDYERDNILEQYEIAVNSTRKTRGAILCSTDKGVFLMREVGVSEKRLPALIELYEYFMDCQGFLFFKDTTSKQRKTPAFS